MAGYVLATRDHEMFVAAKPSGMTGYTYKLRNARYFRTYEAALVESISGECVVSVDDLRKEGKL